MGVGVGHAFRKESFFEIHALLLNRLVGVCSKSLAGGIKQFGFKGEMNEQSFVEDIHGETEDQGPRIRQGWNRFHPFHSGLKRTSEPQKIRGWWYQEMWRTHLNHRLYKPKDSEVCIHMDTTSE